MLASEIERSEGGHVALASLVDASRTVGIHGTTISSEAKIVLTHFRNYVGMISRQVDAKVLPWSPLSLCIKIKLGFRSGGNDSARIDCMVFRPSKRNNSGRSCRYLQGLDLHPVYPAGSDCQNPARQPRRPIRNLLWQNTLHSRRKNALNIVDKI